MASTFLASAFLTGCNIFSYESAYSRTDSGTVEIKMIPKSKILVAESDGSYFDNANQLFRRLFNYIKNNDIAMTVPVEAEMDQARMKFYVGSSDLEKAGKDGEGVKVLTIPRRKVVSLGARGSYSENNFEETRKRLEKWLEEREDLVATADAYAVYWNGPFMPGFMKRFEVHIPVADAAGSQNFADSKADSGNQTASDSQVASSE
jgi:effector-binding domain-containing protein